MNNYTIIKSDPYLEISTSIAGVAIRIYVIPCAEGNILAIPKFGISTEIAGLSNTTYTLDALKELDFNQTVAPIISNLLSSVHMDLRK